MSIKKWFKATDQSLVKSQFLKVGIVFQSLIVEGIGIAQWGLREAEAPHSYFRGG